MCVYRLASLCVCVCSYTERTLCVYVCLQRDLCVCEYVNGRNVCVCVCGQEGIRAKVSPGIKQKQTL